MEMRKEPSHWLARISRSVSGGEELTLEQAQQFGIVIMIDYLMRILTMSFEALGTGQLAGEDLLHFSSDFPPAKPRYQTIAISLADEMIKCFRRKQILAGGTKEQIDQRRDAAINVINLTLECVESRTSCPEVVRSRVA